MEEDILNYSPTVMFRGTPCRFLVCTRCPPRTPLLNLSVVLCPKMFILDIPVGILISKQAALTNTWPSANGQMK